MFDDREEKIGVKTIVFFGSIPAEGPGVGGVGEGGVRIT